MFPTHSPAIYEFLKEQRLVEPAQLDELNEEHKATGKPLADVVIDLGLVEKDALLRRLAEHLGYDYVPELPVQFPGEAIAAPHGTSAGAVALAWVLANPAVTAAIVGARRAGQFPPLTAAATLALSAA